MFVKMSLNSSSSSLNCLSCFGFNVLFVLICSKGDVASSSFLPGFFGEVVGSSCFFLGPPLFSLTAVARTRVLLMEACRRKFLVPLHLS